VAAITEGNIILQDFHSDSSTDELSEYSRSSPSHASPVQEFTDVLNVHGIGIPVLVSQSSLSGGDIIVWHPEPVTWAPVLRVAGADGAVSVFMTGSTAWGDINNSNDVVFYAGVDSEDRQIVVYNHFEAPDTYELWARRFNSNGTILDTIQLESDYDNPLGNDAPWGPAISPSGQYVYALLWDGTFVNTTLYQYDLDNAGARVALRSYTLNHLGSTAAPWALGCHADGSLVVGYGEAIDGATNQFNYFIHRLSSDGTSIIGGPWEVTDLAYSTFLDGTRNGFLPMLSTDIFDGSNTCWGFVYNQFPGTSYTKLLKLDMDSGVVTLYNWNTSTMFSGWRSSIYVAGSHALLLPGLARYSNTAVQSWLITEFA
jgi:hypothetical protein